MKTKAFKVKPMPFLEEMASFHQRASSIPMPRHRDCSGDDDLDIVKRACNPRVGDRFVDRDGITVIEVHFVRPSKGGFQDQGRKTVVQYSDAKSGHHEVFIWCFKEIARSALEKHKLTFHAVEDDEDE